MAVEVRLKEIRNERGISQNELARRLEMSLANVQKIEYGKAKSIPLDTLDKLCKILRCEVGELLVRVPDDDEGNSELSVSGTSATAKNIPTDEPQVKSNQKINKPVSIVFPIEKKSA
jgi:putative transcriptional regulator